MPFFAASPGSLAAQVQAALQAAQAASSTAASAMTKANTATSTASSASAAAVEAMAGMTAPATWNALVQRVADLEAANAAAGTRVRAFGFAPIPALALGGSAPVVVEIGPAQPGTPFSFTPKLVSLGSILATLEILSSSVVDTTHVSVTVRANGVLAGGAAFVTVRV